MASRVRFLAEVVGLTFLLLSLAAGFGALAGVAGLVFRAVTGL